MCCFFTILLFLGPRFAGIVWWLVQPGRWNLAFDTLIFPILGIIFLPWTVLMYVIVAPGGLTGLEWLFVGLMLVFDIGSYAGGGWGNRSRFGG
jgi:hypothetical protein